MIPLLSKTIPATNCHSCPSIGGFSVASSIPTPLICWLASKQSNEYSRGLKTSSLMGQTFKFDDKETWTNLNT